MPLAAGISCTWSFEQRPGPVFGNLRNKTDDDAEIRSEKDGTDDSALATSSFLSCCSSHLTQLYQRFQQALEILYAYLVLVTQ
ncbi:hypothetical protein N7478_008308 [Penicillium angulare]|uniref:uncharacterized protein n=1 Tax=Penicillium angulare TaxID=116970 RepID=UPI0025406422|nr:uncharacterized protein N7478_008308 [Penicillium angulare]KAJ5273183.1 hypothetical protein N7478_008308 [Penicillium angulare]